MNKLKKKLLLLVLQLCVMLPTSASLDCSNEMEMHKLGGKCFQDQGLGFTEPPISDKMSDYKKHWGWLEALLIQRGDDICAHQKEFQAALDCHYILAAQCVDKSQQEKLPVKPKMLMVIPVLCDTQHKMNFDCVKLKTSHLMECGVVPREEEETKEAVCKQYLNDLSCQLDVLRDCGCYTMRAHDQIFRQLLYPPYCPKLPHQTPLDCDSPLKLAYMESPASQASADIAVPLGISVAVIMLLSR